MSHRVFIDAGRAVVAAIVLLLAIVGGSDAQAQVVIYVHPGAAPGGDGSSWGTAHRFLQDALAGACAIASSSNPVEIWVAAGTQLPDRSEAWPDGSGVRSSRFELCSHISLYGGFTGGETSITQRDPAMHETILSADLAQDDDLPGGSAAENAFTLLRMNGVTGWRIDGFTLTGAAADTPLEIGAIMSSNMSSGDFVNCVVRDIPTHTMGGGLSRYPVFEHLAPSGARTIRYENCRFENVLRPMFLTRDFNKSLIDIFDSEFLGNTNLTLSGGGFSNGRISFYRSTIGQQSSGQRSAGGFFTVAYFENCLIFGLSNRIQVSSGGSLTFRNCVIWGGVGSRAVIFAVQGAGLRIENCTIANNTSSQDSPNNAGAVLVQTGAGLTTNVVMRNNIIWGNSHPSKPNVYFFRADAGSFVTDIHSNIIQSIFGNVSVPTTNTMSIDPLFLNQSGPDNIPGTLDDNLRLQSVSPAIDAGVMTNVTPVAFDIDGNPRLVDGNGSGVAAIDLGAYEWQLIPSINDVQFSTQSGFALFNDGANWQGGAAPGVFDNAVFAQSGSNVNILLQNDVEVHRLRFNAARVLALQGFGNYALTATAPFSEEPSLSVGAPAPSIADVTFAVNGSIPITLATADARIGGPGEEGRLTFDGAGVEWIAGDDVVIADDGKGLLTLRSGAEAVITGDLIAARTALSDAELFLDSSASLRVRGIGVAARSSLRLAGAGLAVLDIDDATLEAADFIERVDFADGANAMFHGTVSGPDALLRIASPSLTFGRAGESHLTIADGARMHTTTSGPLTLGALAGSSGVVIIDGEGSEWIEDGLPILVGGEGVGVIELSDGGTITGPQSGFGLQITPSGALLGEGVVASRLLNAGVLAPYTNGGQARGGGAAIRVENDFLQIGRSTGGPTVAGTLILAGVDGMTPGDPPLLEVEGDARFGGLLRIDAPFAATLDATTPLELVSAGANITNSRFDVALLPASTPGGDGSPRFLRLQYQVDPERTADGRAVVTVNVVSQPLPESIEFDPAVAQSFGALPTAATLVDYGDGAGGPPDGFPDLALVFPDPDNPTTAPGTLVVLFNNGVNGAGQWLGFGPSLSVAVGAGPVGIAHGDLDNDKWPDIVTVNSSGGSLSVVRNNGASGVAGVLNVPTGGAPTSVAVGDIDATGELDVAFTDAATDQVRLLFNQGGVGGGWSGLGQEIALAVGSGPMGVAIGDLDNDKWPDLVVTNQTDRTVSVIQSTASQVFAPALTLATGGRATTPVLEDFDLDGRLDIVTLNRLDGSISVLRSDETAPTLFAPAVEIPLAETAFSVAAADLDDDGDLDLAIVVGDGSGSRETRVLRNDLVDGDLQFAPAGTAPGDDPVLVLAGDLNQSGREDLVVIGEDAFAARSGAAGDPDEARITISLGAAKSSPCPGDANGDGVVDFADLSTVLGNFGQTGPNLPGDLTGDGEVNFDDLAIVLANFGTSCR